MPQPSALPVLQCPHCARANNGDARYCWFDGVSLSGAAAEGFAANRTFPTPFEFPSSQKCKDYDEFAEACMQHWDVAVRFLRDGAFQTFFAGIGRMDLAHAARDAAHFPDRDRGFDQFLGRLPTARILVPKLDVQPKLINLGTMKVGETRTLELSLQNHGCRLVFGSITSNCKWLASLPPGAGEPESKLFQFRDTAAITLTINGQHLRASQKPLEGDLLVESNAGSFKLKVIVSVPVVPFAEGALAGAVTPREIAEKARAAPKQAAALFESGSVARWYQANGWSYPVQGPASNGLAAVQQFFEALGLSKPPNVSVDQSSIALKGRPGARLTHQLKVSTEDNRPVYAYATSSEGWLVVKPGVSAGKSVTLPLEITVPDKADDAAECVVQVTSNGQKRFAIGVRVSIERAAPAASITSIAAAAHVTVNPPSGPRSKAKHAALSDLDFGVSKSEIRPTLPHAFKSASFDPLKILLHVAPLVFLGILFLGLVAKDVFSDNSRQPKFAVKEEPPEDRTELKLKEAQFTVNIKDEPDEQPDQASKPRYKIEDEPEERFGKALPAKVQVAIKDEPAEAAPAKGGTKSVPVDPTLRVLYNYDNLKRWGLADTRTRKLLTYSAVGGTNLTVVRVAGQSVMFPANGQFQQLPDDPARETRAGSSYTFSPRPGLRVTQLLEIVPSKQPVDIGGGQQRRLMDTLLVRYVLENIGQQPINSGMRLEIDTLIGGNDGVPFTVPGRGLVNTSADFTSPEQVPDFVQALETGNLKNPGTVVHISLKVGGGVEAPSRVTLCHWKRNGDLSNIQPVAMGSDSAIVMVWPDQPLQPGKRREMGYAYGLGSVTVADPGGTLAVTLGGNYDIGQSFTITAYVNKPAAGQTLTLELPAGLQRIKGEQTQPVAAATVGSTSIVSWEAKVLQTGVFPVKVRSSTGVAQTKTITIAREEAPTGGKLSLELEGAIEPGQVFRVLGNVSEPISGQTLTLDLPPGLQKVVGETTQRVPAPLPGSKDARVQWSVRVIEPGKFPVRVASSTGVARTKTITIVQPGRGEGAFQVTMSGDFVPGKAFTVSATSANPEPDQKLTLLLPAGLQRREGDETQVVRADAPSKWKVSIKDPGKFSVGVKSTTGVTQRKTVVIEPPSDEAGRFTFTLAGDIRPGKEFTVDAQVTNPLVGQTLTLVLPKGLQLAKGPAQQPAPAGQGIATVSWTVRVTASGQLPVRVESSTGLARTKTITLSDANSTLFGR